MKKRYTCIICPNGCEIEAQVEGGEVKAVTGNRCTKGRQYGEQEITAPMRTLTTSVLVTGGQLPLASVRLTKAVPKSEIFHVMEEIQKTTLTAPVKAGSIVIGQVCGLDSDVIATRSVPVAGAKK